MVVCCKSTMPDSGRGRPPPQNGNSCAPLLFCNWLNGIKDRIRKAAADGKSTEALESELYEHERKRPEPRRVPKLLREDTTPEGLAKRLQHDWPSAGVISNEAGIVFGAHGMNSESIMRNLALLNKLWDGGRYQSDRSEDGRCRDVRGARLTMGLMVQEQVLREFMKNSKGLARGSGFVARFLVSWPESTMGTRFYEAPNEGMPALAAFNDRLGEILNHPAPIDEAGALTPAEVTLSPKAKDLWIEYHDDVERELG
jgi:putative DNA primase/helicase